MAIKPIVQYFRNTFFTIHLLRRLVQGSLGMRTRHLENRTILPSLCEIDARHAGTDIRHHLIFICAGPLG